MIPNETAQSESRASVAHHRLPQKAVVLVVEDQAEVVDLVRETLHGNTFLVHSVPSIAEAEGALELTLPDLVILDRSLPDGDGKELCARWKSEERTRRMPVLFMTAHSPQSDELADDRLTKPFIPPHLLERVHGLLSRTPGLRDPAPRFAAGG